MADPNLCERCGRCCHLKMILDAEVVYLPFYCEYYDPETKECTVYERRFEVNPHCLTVAEGIELGVFPADCPYVRDHPGYTPPRTECSPAELELYRRHSGGPGPNI
ncbi:MAG: YcgN family cysteine cluster protein [bacterium]